MLNAVLFKNIYFLLLEKTETSCVNLKLFLKRAVYHQESSYYFVSRIPVVCFHCNVFNYYYNYSMYCYY